MARPRDLFIHVLSYAGVAPAFQSYQVALSVLAEGDSAGHTGGSSSS